MSTPSGLVICAGEVETPRRQPAEEAAKPRPYPVAFLANGADAPGEGRVEPRHEAEFRVLGEAACRLRCGVHRDLRCRDGLRMAAEALEEDRASAKGAKRGVGEDETAVGAVRKQVQRPLIETGDLVLDDEAGIFDACVAAPLGQGAIARNRALVGQDGAVEVTKCGQRLRLQAVALPEERNVPEWKILLQEFQRRAGMAPGEVEGLDAEVLGLVEAVAAQTLQSRIEGRGDLVVPGRVAKPAVVAGQSDAPSRLLVQVPHETYS
ncbi:MAG: hypothetical protein KIT43_10285 [Bauldia sp.]|nr:hypothetical protein [Bauldia sp.]